MQEVFRGLWNYWVDVFKVLVNFLVIRKRSPSPVRNKRSNDYQQRRGDAPDKRSNNCKQSSTSERAMLLSKWRKNYCSTREEVSSKIEELCRLDQEQIISQEKNIWTRSTPADLYYIRDQNNPKIIRGTTKLAQICDEFNENLVLRAKKVNAMKPPYEPPPRKNRARVCKHKCK